MTTTDSTSEQAIAELRHEIEVLWDTVSYWHGAARFYQFSAQHWQARAQKLAKPTTRKSEYEDVS